MSKFLSSVFKDKPSLILTVLTKLDAIATVFGLQKILKVCLLLTIRVYKQYISPHKGFSCAYRILHQEQFCSSYFQTCVREQSFSHACISFQQRLFDCHQANLILQNNVRNRRQKRRRRRNSSCMENNNFNCSDLVDADLLLFHCNPFACINYGNCDF